MLVQIRASFGVLFLALAAFMANAQAPPKPPADALTSDQIKPGIYDGKLLSLPKEDGSFTVEITTQVPKNKPNTAALLQAANKFERDFQTGLANIQRDLASGKNTAQHQNRLRDHVAAYQKSLPSYLPGGANYPYDLKPVVQSIDLTASPDFKVRHLEPPPEFTDKGIPKKYTAAEIKKLKGNDPKLPGYEAAKVDLKTGALVRLTLSKGKQPSKKDITAKDFLHGPKSTVTVIVILSKDGTLPKPANGKK